MAALQSSGSRTANLAYYNSKTYFSGCLVTGRAHCMTKTSAYLNQHPCTLGHLFRAPQKKGYWLFLQ